MEVVSRRDYIATEVIKAKIQVWDSELSKKHRIALLEDMTKRYGSITVNEAFSRMAYEVADAMIEASETKN